MPASGRVKVRGTVDRQIRGRSKETVSDSGFAIHEASRFGGIPHVSVCGGRARCSTCRVRIERGGDRSPRPSDDEARLLRRVGAPPTVRLASQTRPTGDVVVAPLIWPAPTHVALEALVAATGSEQEIAVLFADLRGFTTVAERKLPYDVVYLLKHAGGPWSDLRDPRRGPPKIG